MEGEAPFLRFFPLNAFGFGVEIALIVLHIDFEMLWVGWGTIGKEEFMKLDVASSFRMLLGLAIRTRMSYEYDAGATLEPTIVQNSLQKAMTAVLDGSNGANTNQSKKPISSLFLFYFAFLKSNSVEYAYRGQHI